MTQSPATPLISVVIPVFQDQAGIRACLQALARQQSDTPPFEVIVVDNGASPSIAVDPELPYPVKVLHQPQPGSYAARNLGAHQAIGQVLAFTDADCRPASNWLACGYSTIAASAGRTIVGGEVSLDLPSKPSATALYQWATGFGQESNIRDKHFAATANLFCTRQQFDVIGPFETRLLSGGDREWCWRARRHGFSICHVADALVCTPPRHRLRDAIRQARRVVAGRKMLLELGLAHEGHHAIAKLRSPIQAIWWIVTHSGLTGWDRCRVLCVAILIRTAGALESLRLALGSSAERR